jgi:hypothetical protein
MMVVIQAVPARTQRAIVGRLGAGEVAMEGVEVEVEELQRVVAVRLLQTARLSAGQIQVDLSVETLEKGK